MITLEKPDDRGAFYSGIIAEPPKVMNKYRYLVFFDDGYASYIPHEEIRVVCLSSSDVWDDIHPNSQDFIVRCLGIVSEYMHFNILPYAEVVFATVP